MTGLSRIGFLGWGGIAAAGSLAVALGLGLVYQDALAPGSDDVATPAETAVPDLQDTDIAAASAPAIPEAPAPAPAPDPTANAPGFDVVRIAEDGGALVAGTALPGAGITLRVDGETVAQGAADGAGQFVTMFLLEPSRQVRLMTLEMVLGDGRVIASPDSIVLTPQPVPDDPPAPGATPQLAALTASPGESASPADERHAVTSAAPEPPVDVDPLARTVPSDTVPSDVVPRVAAEPAPVAQPPDAPALPSFAAPAHTAPRVRAPTAAQPPAPATRAGDGLPAPGAAPPVPPYPAPETMASLPAPAPDPSPDVAPDTAPRQPAAIGHHPVARTAVPDQPVVAAPGSSDAPAVSTAPGGPAPQVLSALPEPAPAPMPDAAEAPAPAEGRRPLPPLAAPSGLPAAPQGGGDAALAAATDPGESLPRAFLLRGTGEVELIDRAPQVMDNVVIDMIGYSAEGEVQISGRAARAEPDGALRVYLDNRPVAVARAESGDWRLDLPQIDPGVYTLRVDQLGEDGRVISRFETPFQRETPERLVRALAAQAESQVAAQRAAEVEAEAAAQAARLAQAAAGRAQPVEMPARATPDPEAPAMPPVASTPPAAAQLPQPVTRVDPPAAPAPAGSGSVAPTSAAPPEAARPGIALITVQPGQSLWRISDAHYGDGIRWVQIFRANRDQIRNPDLIFPGQVFALPD